MNNEHVKGAVNNIKGKMKEDVGHAVGANRTESEGVVEQVKGKIQTAVGDVKDAIKHTVDKVLHSDKKN